MPAKSHPEEIKDAFELYLKFNGERFDLIEAEMRLKGWTLFSKQKLLPRGKGENYREGWILKYGWENSLKIKIAQIGTAARTSAESLLFEVETIRKKLFIDLDSDKLDKDKVYQHDKYVNRSIEILAKLDDARDNYANFNKFLRDFLEASMLINLKLAKELVENEEALISWAKDKYADSERK
jgi:hypothetical protein